MSVFVLDTTVLVYAVGTDHPYATPAKRVMEAVADGSLAATTTIEVIQEFAHVRARRRDRLDAIDLAQAYRVLLGPLLTTEETDLDHGLDLWGHHEGLGAFDSILLAATHRIRARGLVTADKALLGVHNAAVVDLASIDSWLN